MGEPIDLEPLFPDRASLEPLGTQLVRRLRSAIESGFFSPGSRLLPSRELARRIGVSRNTVTSAFEQLIAEGYLEARVGAGTFVAAALHVVHRDAAPPIRTLPPPARELEAIREALEAVGSSYGPLRIGAPDISAFPVRTWRRLIRKNLEQTDAHLDYGQSSGLLALREAISRHIAQFRGVTAEHDRIIVVEGTQGALHLIAFALTHRGERIVIEDPCYQLARTIFAAHGLELYAVPVDCDGLRTNDLPRAASLAYVTPSHQFPLGGALPPSRRAALLEWARRTDAYVIEDDYDSEFDAHPLPALQSLDHHERVIYTGTFSKTLAPGLRVGYIVVPRHLAKTFRFARAIVSLGACTHLQRTIADFITHGYFSRHVRRMTAIYERRRRVVVDVLTQRLPAGFSIGPAQTGMHVAITGPVDFDDLAMTNAMPQGHRVLPISTLCVERSDCRGLVVGFSSGDDEQLVRTALLLTESLRQS